MTKVLTTQNAQITTASVEVKTLTISGKQVTQSVFRQLRELPLIADDGALNGVPWGYVNYHPDKCGDLKPHLHVVWQRGSDLLRSRVYLNVVFGTFTPEEGSHFYDAHVLDLLLERPAKSFGGQLPIVDVRRNRAFIPLQVLEGVDIGLYPTEAALAGGEAFAALREALERVASERAADPSASDPSLYVSLDGAQHWKRWSAAEPLLRGRVKEATEALLRMVGPREDATERLAKRFKEVVRTEAARRQRHKEVRAVLVELPHLFIAV